MYSGFETETKPSNLQPFQWPVPENMEVVTRSGEKVTQLTKFDSNDIHCIYGVIHTLVQSWSLRGNYDTYTNPRETERDLFLRPIPRERWVVVVERNYSIWASDVQESKPDAEKSKTQALKCYPTATVSIHKITLP